MYWFPTMVRSQRIFSESNINEISDNFIDVLKMASKPLPLPEPKKREVPALNISSKTCTFVSLARRLSSSSGLLE